MIRIDDIQTGLAHLVGWEQGRNSELDTDLLESESGLTFQQAHPLLTIDNIKGMLPSSDNISDYCEKAVNDGIASMVNRLLEEKTIAGSSKQLFERKPLFDVAGRINNRIASSNCLVGYEIVPMKGLGVTTQIHRIGLQMTGATGAVTVYLFHSSMSEPVNTFTLNVESDKSYQWYSENNVFLRYMLGKGNLNAGGAWYICYNQNDLPEGMEAVNISKDWSREPCQSCNSGDLVAWRAMTRYIRVSPFKVAVDDDFAESPALFDLKDIIYTPSYCYGMNLDISIGCDLSDFIIAQRTLFASVLQKEVALNILRRMQYNPDVTVNRNQLNAALQIDMDGSPYTKNPGLYGDLNRAYKALQLDISGLDSACLACKKQGVRYGIA